MGKIGFVIQEIGYEYNDEYYYRGESGGGTPKKIILNEATAKLKLLELEVEKWRGEDIGYYGGDISELSNNEEEFEDALREIGIDPNDDWRLRIPKEATDEQIKNLIKYSYIRFYEIVEVEVEDNSLPNEEFQPNDNLLELQEVPVVKKSSGIFDSVDDFMTGDVEEVKVPEVVTAKEIKEVVKETEDDFLAIKEEMKRLRDEARSKVKNFFIKGMDVIFDTYSEVKSVSWTQYTPYFNDGEPCEFWCNSDDFGINGYSDYDDGEEGLVNIWEDGEISNYEWNRDENNRITTKRYKNPGARSVKIYEAIGGFLAQLDKDDFKTMFGDHATVIVRKGEITVEEYDHD